MSRLDRHEDNPAVGVFSSDLFIYDENDPGTGGLVTIVIPRLLEERETHFINTSDLRVSFTLKREQNYGEIMLRCGRENPAEDRQVFRLTPEFQSEAKVSFSILFNECKIVALIDGEPLVVAHQP